MFRSLQGRLLVLLVLLLAAAIAAGTLMVQLFRQSASAQVGQADAQIARACDAIAEAYRFYSIGWRGPTGNLEDPDFRRSLVPVVQKALRTLPGIEGGIWQRAAGSIAYAYPTYEGSGPKTDLPQAELPRIRAANRDALAEDRPVSDRYESRSQTMLVTACPLAGPIPQLTAWTMTRVTTLAGRAYGQLMAGLVILLTAVLGAAVLLTRLTLTWSRHVARFETTLAAHDIEDLPKLPITGERELDRISRALNDAGSRLSLAHHRAAELSRRVATGERLAAIGRVVAGVAHEIRNPIAAMRLKTENALAGGAARAQEVLPVILSQIERLDRLLRRLLSVTERDQPHRETVVLEPFLDVCLASSMELAQARSVTLEKRVEIESARFDPEQMRHALDNLVLNAIQAAPAGSRVRVNAFLRDDYCVLSVHDEGVGPPAGIRENLFEPFVTGRPEGTGLGLSIVREVAEAHGGTVRFATHDVGTTFEILLRWPMS